MTSASAASGEEPRVAAPPAPVDRETRQHRDWQQVVAVEQASVVTPADFLETKRRAIGFLLRADAARRKLPSPSEVST